MLATGRHFIKDIVTPDRDISRWANTQSEADLIGVMGEYIVAKYLNIPFDTSVKLDGDDGYDLYLKEYPVQVKSTKYPNGRLVFMNESEIALVNVLTVVENQNVDIKGYITKKNVLKNMKEENLGHGIRLTVTQEHLTDIAELKFYA